MKIDQRIQDIYDRTADQYRRDDDLAVTGEDHRQICAVLRGICESFERSITVLELGCGTGRNFHCLGRNVAFLTGVDISRQMLIQASTPVHENDAPSSRTLVHENFYSFDAPGHTFDFIYAVGTFGHGCELTLELAGKITCWLMPGGVFFFDVADADGLSFFERTRKRLRDWVYGRLPSASQAYWDSLTGSVPMWQTNERQLLALLQLAGFKNVEIARRTCQMPCGEGWKLQVKAST